MIVAAIFATGCGPNKQLIATQTHAEANQLTEAGQYAEAFAKYTSEAASGAAMDSTTLRNATIAASYIGKDSAAVAWGTRYSSCGDQPKLKALEVSYGRLGMNDERKSLILSDTTSFFAILGQQPVLEIKARELASVKSEELVSVFGRLESKEVKSELFDTFFKMAQKSLSAKSLEKSCKDQLKVNPEQESALKYLGTKKYEAAESSYSKLMNDYNKNKTQAAYAYLTRDLKKTVTPLYRESKEYFNQLHKLDPENKTYIKYLININDRLSNSAEVKRLKKLL